MKKLSLIMLSIFVLLCWTKAEGADWVYYGKSSERQSTFYYDKKSIRNIGNGRKLIWIKEVYDRKIKQESETDQSATETLKQYMFDCPSGQIKQLSYIHYIKDKIMYSSDDNPQDGVHQASFKSVVPETEGEAIYNIVCNKSEKH